MQSNRGEKLVHWLFVVSILGKGIDGALEIVGGALLFLVNPEQISYLLRILTQHELSEDPHDFIVNVLLSASKNLSVEAQFFGAVYLLWHGIVKAGLITALLRRQLWAYPAAILAFLLFLVYQLYRYTHTHSPWLLVLSAVDVFVILFTWLEWKRLERRAHLTRH